MRLPNYYGSVDKTAVEVIHHIFVKSLARFFFFRLIAWVCFLYNIYLLQQSGFAVHSVSED